ncbi:hypothetical protein [Gilliamella sp. wkB112]|uniref:hypothetical protein n=1 Tax=Gilliamella sp. wkB112 TaxID=3120257 RepID=UPI00080E30F5|nr:hypothetical protein [Gilliamella apicola]OCG04655.1 hypothetical protein A9G12_06475 [Gilliamella apicola]
MEKVSFFKLPFIFVVLLFVLDSLICNVLFMFNVLAVYDDYLTLLPFLSRMIVYQLFRLIPDCLFFFVVCSIALYRSNIHIVTLKNIAILLLNICLLNAISYLLLESADFLYRSMLSNIIPSDSWLVFLFIGTIPSYLSYILGSLWLYFFIKFFSKWFDKSKQPFELTSDNSRLIHLTLFMVVFLFIGLEVTSSIMDVSIYQNKFYISYTTNIILPLITFIISALIVILIIGNSFTQTFMILQTGRIIRSIAVAFLLLFLVNCFFIFTIFILDNCVDWSHSSFSLLAKIVIGLVSFIFSCLILRYVTQRYFSRRNKYCDSF